MALFYSPGALIHTHPYKPLFMLKWFHFSIRYKKHLAYFYDISDASIQIRVIECGFCSQLFLWI